MTRIAWVQQKVYVELAGARQRGCSTKLVVGVFASPRTRRASLIKSPNKLSIRVASCLRVCWQK